MPLEISIAILAALSGPYAMWAAFFCLSSLIILGDLFLPPDESELEIDNPILLNISLYCHLPLLSILVGIMVYMTSTQNMGFPGYVGYILLVGLLIGGAGMVVGHELTHQTGDRFKMFVGNWLYGVACEPFFSIEHVYGHHKHVGLKRDPATARRGETIYPFILRSTIGQVKHAWKIEQDRLRKKGLSEFSRQNRILRSMARSGCVLSAVAFFGNLTALICFISAVLWAKIMLETVNYMEHYGLVRQEDTPVKPRHSWNTNAMISSLILFNLTRHSHHHEKASLDFWDLKPYHNAPEMPYGYLSMLYFILLFPYAYHRVMRPSLENWDKKYASEGELTLL